MAIKFNFDKAIKQAGELEQIALVIRNLANNKMTETTDKVRNAWNGEAASEFLRKMQEIQIDIRKEGESIESIARALRQAAAALKRAEEEAEKIIQN